MNALSIPIGSVVRLTRKKKNVSTLGKVIAHWDDDAGNGGRFRTGLMILMAGFTCGGIKCPTNTYRMIQRPEGNYFPRSQWGSKVGSLDLEVVDVFWEDPK